MILKKKKKSKHHFASRVDQKFKTASTLHKKSYKSLHWALSTVTGQFFPAKNL